MAIVLPKGECNVQWHLFRQECEMKRIGVFCGSSSGRDAEYGRTARALGRALAAAGLGLVYGGSAIGLMREIAEGVLEEHGEAIGVITRQLADKKLGHPGLTELRVVDTMHERKATMSELADGFIALPGGVGTLDELFEILTWALLGLHCKPCGLLNARGYYDRLREFLTHAADEHFIQHDYLDLLLVDTDPANLLRRFKAYQPPQAGRWLDLRIKAETFI